MNQIFYVDYKTRQKKHTLLFVKRKHVRNKKRFIPARKIDQNFQKSAIFVDFIIFFLKKCCSETFAEMSTMKATCLLPGAKLMKKHNKKLKFINTSLGRIYNLLFFSLFSSLSQQYYFRTFFRDFGALPTEHKMKNYAFFYEKGHLPFESTLGSKL